jgi:hypothetical protein
VDFLGTGNPWCAVRLPATAAGVGSAWAWVGDDYYCQKCGIGWASKLAISRRSSLRNFLNTGVGGEHRVLTRYQFTKNATLRFGSGLNPRGRCAHSSVHRQRLSSGILIAKKLDRRHPKFGRNTLIFCKREGGYHRGQWLQPIQHKLLIPHPNECGRKRELDRATTATKHRS